MSGAGWNVMICCQIRSAKCACENIFSAIVWHTVRKLLAYLCFQQAMVASLIIMLDAKRESLTSELAR